MGTHRLKNSKARGVPSQFPDLFSLRLAPRRSQEFKGNAVVNLSQVVATHEMASNVSDLTLQRFNDSRGESLIIRSALEVNPFLTISALAEHIVASLSHSAHAKA
jgi:hypothetical protein